MVKEKYLTITVDVEEWFHSNWFDSEYIINKYYDGKIPHSNVVGDVDTLIRLFDGFNVKATFFVLGGTAKRYPDIIDLIQDAGHEIASHGFIHQLNGTDSDEFKDQVRKFKKEIFAHPKGFRFPNYEFNFKVLEFLSDEGFLYDSSMVPSYNIPGWYGDPHAPIQPHVHLVKNDQGILEFPISVSPFLRLPGAGGWFLRNASFLWTFYVITSQLHHISYGNLYVHNWEISQDLPSHLEIPFHVFRNTGKPMMDRLHHLIQLWKNLNYIHIVPFEELLDHELNDTS